MAAQGAATTVRERPDLDPDRASDPRVQAFCSDVLPDLFHAFAYSSDVWKVDPLDVESIHEGARKWFDRMVDRVLASTDLPSGRILLILGESGSGKTHLMRAFRNRVHSRHRGYCGYLQMTAFTGQYGRYVLNNLVESLDRPYHEADSPVTGLARISNALASSLDPSSESELHRLGEGERSQEAIDRAIGAMADQVILEDRFRDIDIYLVQAILYLQCHDPRIKARVLKYLRCEDLTPQDRRLLGGIVPCTYPDAPSWVIQRLGQLIWAVEKVPLILCVDQLEDVFDLEDAAIKFRKAMATLCDLVSRLPSAIVVISCLENFYDELKKLLTRPIKDRVENDPRPVSLHSPCGQTEIERLIGLRLEYLYSRIGAPYRWDEPTFPLPEELVRRLVGLRARDVLLQCQLYRERCIEEGKMACPPCGDHASGEQPLALEQSVAGIEQAWNDLRSSAATIVPSEENELASILAQAARGCALELLPGYTLQAEADGRFVQIELQMPERKTERILVGICNKAPQGGWLGREVEELLRRAVEQTAVAVRSTAYPSNPKATVTKLLRDLEEGGGRRVVVEDSDWRTMLLLAKFHEQHAGAPAYVVWRQRTRPLSSLSSLRLILGLDRANRGVTP